MAGLRSLQVILTVLCGVFLALSFWGLPVWIPYLSVICGSYFAAGSMFTSLKARSLDVNFLMVIAAIGAVAVGKPQEAAALLFLFSLSSTLEAYAMARTRSAIDSLVKLRPSEAILVGEEGDKKVRVEELKKGDHVRVLPFEHFPADGVLVGGSGTVNESAMTGESVPVSKSAGDRVLAGTQNLESMLIAAVESEIEDSTLERIVALVRDAQENKASGERISTWFGERYTIFVIVAFCLSFAIRLALKQPLNVALYEALILLVALSPCALVISTPATTLSALAWAARNGVLVRGGEFIENIGRVTSAALDKTGTLTAGRFKLVEICVCSDSVVPVHTGGSLCVDDDACWDGKSALSSQARNVLRAAAAAEQYSTHPIAEAIVSAARDHGLEVPEASEQRTESGLGVIAQVEGKPVKVGQRRYFENLPNDFLLHAKELQQKGMTVVVLEFEGQLAALGLRDEPRPDAHQMLDELQKLGLNPISMLTGDTNETAQAVGAELGLTDIHAALLPAAKTAIIEDKEARNERVMMVGDGVNDAPSLARATVGVAMGGLGSDIALNAADIVLMKDKLGLIPQMIRLGRKTNRIVRANLFFAASVIVCLTIGSMIGLKLPLAVLGHEGSTVLVILNGLRLLRGP